MNRSLEATILKIASLSSNHALLMPMEKDFSPLSSLFPEDILGHPLLSETRLTLYRKYHWISAKSNHHKPLSREDILSSLDEGMTLKIEEAWRLHPTLEEMRNQMASKVPGASCSMNCYYSLQQSLGTGLHQDKYASFILQIQGAKGWTILADKENGAFEQIPFLTTPGDLLYIPAKVVHNAYPKNSTKSLHLTVSFPPVK